MGLVYKMSFKLIGKRTLKVSQGKRSQSDTGKKGKGKLLSSLRALKSLQRPVFVCAFVPALILRHPNT